MRKGKKNDIVIYQSPNGAIELRGDIPQETIWATQTQIVQLYGVDQSVVSRHIKNIFKQGEVDGESNMQKMHIANSDKSGISRHINNIIKNGELDSPTIAKFATIQNKRGIAMTQEMLLPL